MANSAQTLAADERAGDCTRSAQVVGTVGYTAKSTAGMAGQPAVFGSAWKVRGLQSKVAERDPANMDPMAAAAAQDSTVAVSGGLSAFVAHGYSRHSLVGCTPEHLDNFPLARLTPRLPQKPDSRRLLRLPRQPALAEAYNHLFPSFRGIPDSRPGSSY